MATQRSVDLGPTPAQIVILGEFQRRLAYIAESYRLWSKVIGHGPSINESLARAKRSVARSSSGSEDVRLNLEFEAALEMIARAEAEKSKPTEHLTPEDIADAREKLIRSAKPIKGRPKSRVLRYHVQALMLLCEWATGVPVTASPTTGTAYKPQMTSVGARVTEAIFKAIDRSITTTTLMNIVRTTRQRRELHGKRFEDFFPFYGAKVTLIPSNS